MVSSLFERVGFDCVPFSIPLSGASVGQQRFILCTTLKGTGVIKTSDSPRSIFTLSNSKFLETTHVVTASADGLTLSPVTSILGLLPVKDGVVKFAIGVAAVAAHGLLRAWR